MADHPICRTCGTQYDAGTPAGCRICEDERQYVGWDGQRWTTLAELSAEGYRNRVEPEPPGLLGIGTAPSFAIGQRALLVPGEGGNLLWDCVTLADEEAVEAVRAAGGLAAIAISHPHYYSGMVEWSRAFGDVPIHLHAGDKEWVCRSDGNVRFWDGDTAEVLPGRTLVHSGVHFAGGTVLHAAIDSGGTGGIVCSGDILQVTMDRRWFGFMYSYPNLIPEHPDTVRRTVRMLEPFDFDVVYGAWWSRVVIEDAKAAVRRSAQRYLRHLGLPED